MSETKAGLTLVPEAEAMSCTLFSELPSVMGTSEAARALDTNTNTLRQLIASGQLRAVRIGRVYKVSKQALLDFLGEN